ncbi:MAG: TonB-dependent receptor [Novosphingobium sp.]
MKAKFAFLSAVACCALSTPALAQAAQADDAAQGDEIIVTATLREADVQDIPLAVTAVSPQTLERQGIADIKTLSSISPSFNIQSSQTETQGTSIRIRGVGTTGNNTGLESSVGVFIDGVYQSRPGVALGDLVDLERLEVLRGPQGTLFGRNTSAGALNITTKRPSLTKSEGFVNATYGNYNTLSLQGGISTPLSDIAAVRVTGSWRKRDGFLTSSTGAESNNRDRYMVRGQVYVEPTPDISVRLIAEYSKVNENCCDAVIVRETELAPYFVGPVGAFPGHGLTSDGVDQSGLAALNNLSTNGELFRNSARQWGLSGELKWDIGGAKITYIGSYRDFSSESTQESDFTSLRIFSVGVGGSVSRNGIDPNGDDIKTTTHELRIQGKAFDDKLDWLVGGFFGHEDIVSVGSMTAGPDFQAAVSAGNFGAVAGVNPLYALTALGNGGVPVNINGAYAVNRFDQSAETFSIFTHNVFSITDSLSLTVGARYVDEKKTASFDQLAASNGACQASVNGVLTAAVPAPLRAGLVGLNCFPFIAPVTLTAPVPGAPLASRFLPVPREWADTFKDDEITYTIQLSYKPADDWMIYGGMSHGFKSGGFNLDPTAANLINSTAVLTTGATPVYADPRFNSEKVDAYEFGVKGKIGRLNANVAVFHMDMSDFQVLEFTGVQFTTFNVYAARSLGMEFELFGKLTDNLSINTAFTVTDSKYLSNCAQGVAPANLASVQRLCGQKLTNAPDFTAVAGVTYETKLGTSGWGLTANVNANYSGRRRTTTQALDTNGLPNPFDWQEDYIKVNARIGLSMPGDTIAFELWATNLTNEITRGVTANTPLRGGAGTRSRVGFVEEPRMYGVTVRAKF